MDDEKIDGELSMIRLRIQIKMVELETLQRKHMKLTGKRFSGISDVRKIVGTEDTDVHIQDRG